MNETAEDRPILAREVNWYHVNIVKVENGIIITVGCKRFVFDDINKAFELLKSYYDNPAEMESKFYNGELFKK